MAADEIQETEHSLTRLKKVSKAISLAFRVFFCIYCVIWIALVCIFAFSAFSKTADGYPMLMGIAPLISCLIFGFLMAVAIRFATLIFADVAKGESPFTTCQVKRIRWVAIVFLIYVVIEAIVPSGLASVVQNEALHVGYRISEAPLDVPVFKVNFGMLGAAVIFYCLSLVFEYGTLLQRLSDETL